jgi:hypothetical protein
MGKELSLEDADEPRTRAYGLSPSSRGPCMQNLPSLLVGAQLEMQPQRIKIE